MRVRVRAIYACIALVVTHRHTQLVVTQIADQWLDHGRQDDLIHGVCVPIHYRAHDIVHDDRA